MRQSRAGYSLFEVLVAFAIMAMVLSVLLPRQANMLERANQIDERVLAQDYAMSRMALLRVIGPLVPGQTTSNYDDWVITENVVPLLLGGTEISAFNVEVTVQNERGAVLAILETLMASDEQP